MDKKDASKMEQQAAELGEALREARARAGLTVRQLGEKSGMAPATITRLETGQIDKPWPEHLRRLSAALDVDLEDLYAAAGYLMPEGLPELRPYLRAKYGLGDTAIDRLDEYFQALRSSWESEAKEGSDHDRGGKNS